MKNFALIGAAGYVAPRHMQAIRDTGNRLVCALDKSDSVGILDRYFDDVDFFTEFERFDRHVERLRIQEPEKALDYVSICSPNYIHDAHIRFALRVGADALCEKPLVLNPWNLDALEELEQRSGQRVWNVLQLRVHPSLLALKERLAQTPSREKHEIDLTYITSRGKWYDFSWKGELPKSGGIATNIGIHFFDMLIWLFGAVQDVKVYRSEARRNSGFLELERARVRWFLSLEKSDLPEAIRAAGQPTYRSITLDGGEIEFSGGFTDLHTVIYENMLAGRGFGLRDARPSIEVAHRIRHALPATPSSGQQHPFLEKINA
ncbi:MAG: gfo/Idh/MocA family oxidoreductase [Calditrichaeota bacterium]|nr:MAG: gfo/Idh/MocA family oxidoreductase [Calditrichota bacterium]